MPGKKSGSNNDDNNNNNSNQKGSQNHGISKTLPSDDRWDHADLNDQQTHFEFMLHNYGVTEHEYIKYLQDPDSSSKQNQIEIAWYQSMKWTDQW